MVVYELEFQVRSARRYADVVVRLLVAVFGTHAQPTLRVEDLEVDTLDRVNRRRLAQHVEDGLRLHGNFTTNLSYLGIQLALDAAPLLGHAARSLVSLEEGGLECEGHVRRLGRVGDDEVPLMSAGARLAKLTDSLVAFMHRSSPYLAAHWIRRVKSGVSWTSRKKLGGTHA